MKDHAANELIDGSRAWRRFDKRYEKSKARRFDDDAPNREPMGGRGRHRRGVPRLNRRIIQRFLHSRVGRPWAAVWAELTATLRTIPDAVGSFDDIVNLDGPDPRGRAGLFVCPRTGLLRATPPAYPSAAGTVVAVRPPSIRRGRGVTEYDVRLDEGTLTRALLRPRERYQIGTVAVGDRVRVHLRPLTPRVEGRAPAAAPPQPRRVR